jgi:hypothetical protein
MKPEFHIAELVKSAQSGHADAGRTLAYALSGIICLSMHEIGFNHFECERENDYRRLRWSVVGTPGIIRISILKGGRIKFRLHNHQRGRGTCTIYPNIHAMINEFRCFAARVHDDSVPGQVKQQ